MIFKELLDSVKDEDVLDILDKFYAEDLRESYGLLLKNLRAIKEIIREDKLKLCVILFENTNMPEDGEVQKPSPDAFGYNFVEKTSYSLVITERAEWLGYDIFEKCFKYMSKEEFVAHCLWEMAYFGFNEDEVIDKKEEIIGKTENLEEKINNIGNDEDEDDDDEEFFSLEDLKAELERELDADPELRARLEKEEAYSDEVEERNNKFYKEFMVLE